MGRQVRKTTAAVLMFFSMLSLLLTYPLPLHLASAVEDRQDALLNVWITAWDGHQLLSDPVHLFDANIFHPYAHTLAYSELLLGNGLLSLPITAASGNPVLGYNVALVLSFVLTGWGTYLLVLALTRCRAAGIVAGIVLAFSSYRMTNLAQAQLLTTQWMPFALLSLIQLLRLPRLRHVVTFTLFFALQALSSFYYGILLAMATVGLVILWLGWWLVSRTARRSWQEVDHGAARGAAMSVLLHLLLTAACCALLVLPFALPYFRVQRELGFERTLVDSEPFSASLRQYSMVPPRSTIHGWWLPSDETPREGGYAVDALFPGLTAVVLGLLGVIRGRGRVRWAFVLMLLAAWILSLGPRLYLAPGQPSGLDVALPYAWLYAIVPGFKALRAPVRFDALVTLALSVLGGYGLASVGRSCWTGQRRGCESLRMSPMSDRQQAWAGERIANQGDPTSKSRWPRALWVRVLCLRVGGVGVWLLPIGTVAVAVLESWVWPAANAELVPVGDNVPLVTRWLADQPPGPVLELPMAFTAGGPQLEYQYLSTYHWQPTPDGYSGFIPPKHGQIVYEMERFPSERSVSLLQALGIRHVVLHTDRYPPGRLRDMEEDLVGIDALVLVQTYGTDRVYRLQPRSFTPSALTVRPYFPRRTVSGAPYTAYVLVLNSEGRSYAIKPTELIRPTVVWDTEEGQQVDIGTADVPLVTSPGGAAVIPVSLVAPEVKGTYHLALGEQGGPIGAWSLESWVEVGDQADTAFPVPAQLVAWTLPSAAQTGHSLDVHLTWKALGKLDAYYSVFVKLLDSKGGTVASWDGQPDDGQGPTLLWVPGESIDDSVVLAVPDDLPTGRYTVEVGMYRAEDLARCLLLDGEGYPVASVTLGTVRVE